MSTDLRATAENLTKFTGFYSLMYSFRTLFIAVGVLMTPALSHRVETFLVYCAALALYCAIGVGMLRGVPGWRVGGAALLALTTLANALGSFSSGWYKAGYLTVDAVLLAAVCYALVRPSPRGS